MVFIVKLLSVQICMNGMNLIILKIQYEITAGCSLLVLNGTHLFLYFLLDFVFIIQLKYNYYLIMRVLYPSVILGRFNGFN